MKPCPNCGYTDRALAVNAETVRDAFDLDVIQRGRVIQSIPVLVIRVEEAPRPVLLHLPRVVLADSES